MAPRNIVRHDRIIKVLFCLISICLGVNSPNIYRKINKTYDKETKALNIKTQYEYNQSDNDIDKNTYGEKYKYLYDKDFNDWSGFFTFRNLIGNFVERKSGNDVKSKNYITDLRSDYLKYDTKGECNKQFKRKHKKKEPAYDLNDRIMKEWAQRRHGESQNNCEANDDDETVCIDDCPIDMTFGPTLPENCTKSTIEGFQDVVCTNITRVPDLSKQRHIDRLCFEYTKIKSFEAKDSCKLPRVDTLVFDTSPLEDFDGSLIHCKCLKHVIIIKSELKFWNFWLFSDKEASIEFIDLRSNKISYVQPPHPTGQPPQGPLSTDTSGHPPLPWICEPGKEEVTVYSNEPRMPRLETLILNDNQLINLPWYILSPLRNSPVRNLLLKNCSLESFCGNPFNYMQNLTHLDLSDNKNFSQHSLAELLEPLKNRYLSVLYLTGNEYSIPPLEALQKVSSSLNEVFLNQSSFHHLEKASFPLMPNLEILAIGYSKITMICAGTFEGLPKLRELYLEGNKLNTISPAVLVPSLQILNFNDQEYENGEVFQLDTVDFHAASELKSLLINNVPLMEINENTFFGLHNLTTLEINGAEIVSIAKESFRNMKKLTELYINENYIEYLPPYIFQDLTKLEHLEIQNNCLSFMTFNDISPKMSSQLQLGGTTPLVAWFKGIKRKFMANSNTQSLAFDKNDVSPTSPFSQQFNLKYMDLSHNSIRFLFEDLFVDMKSLTYLNLNQNSIDEWDDTLFRNSKNFLELDLYGNKISRLTDGMINSFDNVKDVINLQDNDFTCDCSLEYLKNDSRFVNYPEYLCKDDSISNGPPYTKIDDYLNGPVCYDCPMTDPPSSSVGLSFVDLITMVVVPLVAFFSLGMIAITGYRKRWFALYMMHKFSNQSREYKEQVKSKKYMYDTFVCYASADRQWIFEQLIPKLEDKERLVVCVHERDFTVGQEITDNIVESIDRSRKVIVVLSPAFVKSSWCMFELKIANCSTIKTRQSKLIFIILEYIHDDIMPKTLDVLLKTRTYIPWILDPDSQKLFWARIKRAVAKPSESETQVNTKL